MNPRLVAIAFLAASLIPVPGRGQGKERRISLAEYRDKVEAAWTGQIVGAMYGFPFEGKARNAITLDHYLRPWDFAPVDDDYYYEMVALYGFERFGVGMTVEQLGDMWKEYRAGAWGSSEQARLALERGIRAPMTGHPRYNRWFHTIGPEFSSDIYGMISPGMVNLAGQTARTYSHVNGYAEGSDGAVFVAACISEAFFEADPLKIVRQAAQLIDPRSNYRKAIDQVLAGYAAGLDWRELAAETEARWRPDYPQMNSSVANGALVAIGLLYGGGDYLKSINVVTGAGDFTDADCNAANVSSIVGAMRGTKCLPRQLVDPLNNRIYGDHMGPLKLGRTIDEKIDGLAARVAAVGEKNVQAHGARISGGILAIPVERATTQPLEFFDINSYGPLWNPDWKLSGAARGGEGATYLDGDVLVTFPRDTRPCRLERVLAIPDGHPHLDLTVGAEPASPWRLQVFVNNDKVLEKEIRGAGPAVQWEDIGVDLTAYAGQKAIIRLYQWRIDGHAGSAHWRSVRVR